MPMKDLEFMEEKNFLKNNYNYYVPATQEL